VGIWAAGFVSETLAIFHQYTSRTYLQHPTTAEDPQPAVNAAGAVHCFVAEGKRGSVALQMAQVLLVPAIDHARAPEGEAAYEERRQGEERGRNDKWSA